MKKILTVSLFAIMAVGAANAKIASTDYVDDLTGTATFTAGSSIASSEDLTAAVNVLADKVDTVVGSGTGSVADQISDALKEADATKFSTTVQESLTKADGAVQTVGAGSANGTIAVDGTDVAVTGLGTAAYTNVDAYDAKGSAKAVDDKLQALDGTDTLADGKYYKAYTQTDGKISMTPADFKGSIVEGESSLVAPTAKAVSEFVATATGSLGVDGVKGNINELQQDVAALERDKANKGTTLEDYGITDAMTKTAIEGAIGTAKGEAIEAAATATGNVIGGLDSSAAATSGSVLTGVTITDGKITAKQEMALTALANFPVECATSHCALTNNGTTLSWEIVE